MHERRIVIADAEPTRCRGQKNVATVALNTPQQLTPETRMPIKKSRTGQKGSLKGGHLFDAKRIFGPTKDIHRCRKIHSPPPRLFDLDHRG